MAKKKNYETKSINYLPVLRYAVLYLKKNVLSTCYFRASLLNRFYDLANTKRQVRYLHWLTNAGNIFYGIFCYQKISFVCQNYCPVHISHGDFAYE